MKVLIVEDEIRIREGIEKLLSKMTDFELVGQAEDGREGLQMVQELQPDIVITDIRMEEMDGLQMLTELSQLGIRTKAIVLSAYSEFEYARRAMKLGVTEYLLKPISFSDFSEALQNAKMQVDKDRMQQPEQIGTLEQIIHGVLGGQIELNDSLYRYLESAYQIKEDDTFGIAAIYTGDCSAQLTEKVKNCFSHAFSVRKNLSSCLIESNYRNTLLAIVYHYDDAHDLARWIQTQVLGHTEIPLSVGWIETTGIENIRQTVETLYPYLEWSISLDQQILISYPKILNVRTISCTYPFELEMQMKVAVCAADYDKVHKIAESFHAYFLGDQLFAPKEIKNCYVRFLWSIVAIAKEVNALDESTFDRQKLLNSVMNAKLRKELLDAAGTLLQAVVRREEDNVTHLTVKRVTGIVHEFYKTGITLEEIGIKLNTTPEYLGTLFHKEMGVTFSKYIKNYRITKAKELLCGTQLKLYEIAEQVGYQDAKYFSKVFKEVTGQLPTEYRKTIN